MVRSELEVDAAPLCTAVQLLRTRFTHASSNWHLCQVDSDEFVDFEMARCVMFIEVKNKTEKKADDPPSEGSRVKAHSFVKQ